MNEAQEAAWAQRVTVGTVAAVLRLIGDDGHGIYAPEAVLRCGVPTEIVERYTVLHERSADPRQRIADLRGKPVDMVKGVHGLALLGALAHGLGLPVAVQASRRRMAHGLAVELARWVADHGGVPPALGPEPSPTGVPPLYQTPVAGVPVGGDPEGTVRKKTPVRG
jgi:hypothetical protein